MLEGFGTGHHGCCLEKLTRKAACKTSVLPRVITIMSFDFSSRFLYTPEAPFRTFFLFVAFTLFFFFDISGSDKQPSFVLFRSQFQFFTPDLLKSSGIGSRRRTTVGLRASASSSAGVRRPGGRSGASRRSRICKERSFRVRTRTPSKFWVDLQNFPNKIKLYRSCG